MSDDSIPKDVQDEFAAWLDEYAGEYENELQTTFAAHTESKSKALGIEPYTPLWRDLEWKAFSDSVRPYETRFARKAFRAFVALGDVAVKTLKAGSDQESILAEVRATSLRLFARIGEQEFPLVLRYGWNRANRQIAALSRRRSLTEMETRGVFDLAFPEVASYLRDRVRKYSPQVTDTTITGFREVLVETFNLGKGIADMAREISSHFAEVGRRRSVVISRTEVISASGAATQANYAANTDVVEGKQWLAQIDGRQRPSHETANGQERAVNEPFDVEGYKLMHPGDTSLGAGLETIIQCRCSQVPVTKGLAGFD